MSLETSVSPEKLSHFLQLRRRNLADAVDAALSGIRVRNAKQLRVVEVVLLEVQQPNGTRTDQTACKRWLGHDHHGIQGSAVGSQGVGNESVIKGVADRSMEDSLQKHHSGGLGVFVFVTAPSRNLHQEIDQT